MSIVRIDQAQIFYHNQQSETEMVTRTYQSYEDNIQIVKNRLEQLTKTLPSPIPSVVINEPVVEKLALVDKKDYTHPKVPVRTRSLFNDKRKHTYKWCRKLRFH